MFCACPGKQGGAIHRIWNGKRGASRFFFFNSEREDITMKNIYKGTLGLTGNTPLVEAVNLEKA